MPHSEHIIHFHHLKNKKSKKLFRKKLTAFDKLVFAVTFLYPLSALPQIFEVAKGNTAGVSILSWTIFLLCSALFLTYGLKNKVFPMIISNVLWVIMDSIIVISLFHAQFV